MSMQMPIESQMPEPMMQWKKSKRYKDLVFFLKNLNLCARSRRTRESCLLTAPVLAIKKMLQTMNGWLTDLQATIAGDAPLSSLTRLQLFRKWYHRLCSNATDFSAAIAVELITFYVLKPDLVRINNQH